MKTKNLIVRIAAVVGVAFILSVTPASAQECPEFVGFLDLGCSANDVALSPGFAYVVCGEELIVVDVSDPYMPREVGSLSWDGDWPVHVSVFGVYAFVTVNTDLPLSWLKVVDISQPSIPVELGSIVLSAMSPPVGGINAATEGYAYVVRGDEVLVIDVNDPWAPTVVGSLPGNGPGGVKDVSIVGERAYVLFTYSPCNDGSALLVFDVSDPSNPAALGHAVFWVDPYPGCTLTTRLAVDNRGYAYVPGNNYSTDPCGGVDIFDVRDPQNIHSVGGGGPDGGCLFSVAASGGFAYLTENHSALGAMNVVDPSNPFWLGDASSFGSAEDIYVDRGYVYVADGDAGLTIFRECGPFYDGFESGDTAAWSSTKP